MIPSYRPGGRRAALAAVKLRARAGLWILAAVVALLGIQQISAASFPAGRQPGFVAGPGR